jgi:predicted PurR-regulated permease PerM
MTIPTARPDLARTTMLIIFIVVLIGACLWILRPFLPAIFWAVTLVIATWPIMLKTQARLWNSRGLAVCAMSLVLLLVFVAPFWAAIGTIVVNADQIMNWGESLSSLALPQPPSWLIELPAIGPMADQAWRNALDFGVPQIAAKLRPYAGVVTGWFLDAVGSFGMVVFQFLLTLGVAAIIFLKGERAADIAIRFGLRLAGERGRQSALLAAKAIRGVAIGVVGTALIQAAIAAFGLAIAGVPFASVLCAIVFMLCIAQLGPILVMVPAVIWTYFYGDLVWAIFLFVCTGVAVASDNIIRPILIKRGVDLPLLIILAGVIGGMIAFGLIGIFLGPTVLAIGYTLLGAWIDHQEERSAA